MKSGMLCRKYPAHGSVASSANYSDRVGRPQAIIDRVEPCAGIPRTGSGCASGMIRMTVNAIESNLSWRTRARRSVRVPPRAVLRHFAGTRLPASFCESIPKGCGLSPPHHPLAAVHSPPSSLTSITTESSIKPQNSTDMMPKPRTTQPDPSGVVAVTPAKAVWATSLDDGKATPVADDPAEPGPTPRRAGLHDLMVTTPPQTGQTLEIDNSTTPPR